MLTTAYAILWWSGDVFNEQLTMSVAEFVLSLAINGPCFIVVLMYYLRISGRLRSDKQPSNRPPLVYQSNRPPTDIPPWHYDFPDQPPYEIRGKLRRRERSKSPKRYPPPPYEPTFRSAQSMPATVSFKTVEISKITAQIIFTDHPLVRRVCTFGPNVPEKSANSTGFLGITLSSSTTAASSI
jgi:hypothetical protein